MYNNNAQILESQVVIRDSMTVSSKTNGSLIVQGGISTLDTYVTGNTTVNDVVITPNLDDIIYEHQDILSSSNYEWSDITDFYFRNTVTTAFKTILYVETETNLNSIWEINAVKKGTDDWTYYSSFTGDHIPDVDFRIINKTINGVPSGQVQYQSTTPLNVRYRAWTSSDINVDPTQEVAIITNTRGSFIDNSMFYASSPNTIGYSKGLKYDGESLSISKDIQTVMSNTNSFINFSNGGALTVMGSASVNSNLIIGQQIGINTTNPAYELDLNGVIRSNGLVVSGNVTIGGNIVPDTDIAYDLGSTSNRWRDVYLSGDTIYLGDTQIKVTDGSVLLGDSLELTGDLSIAGNTFTENRGVSYSYGNVWTTSGPSSDRWYSVCWAPELGLFCAVADDGGGNRVMTSPDGINWTIRVPANYNSWRSVCWSSKLGIFCAVASSGNGNRVMTSPDGINWTSRVASANVSWYSVCWASELDIFCAISWESSTKVMTSTNGITWISRIAPNLLWQSICWAPEIRTFCCVANQNVVMTSSNGINWTSRSVNSSVRWTSVCWSPNLSIFCAVGRDFTNQEQQNPILIMTSPDGIDWTFRSNPINTQLRSVCWSNELQIFCVVASNNNTNNVIMTSPDGINWTAINTSTNLNNLYSVCWSPELATFCTVGHGNGNRTGTSSATINNNVGGKMAITQKNRRLAIGHYAPQVELDVKGSIRSTNQILAPSGTGSTSTTTGIAGISFYGDSNTGLFRPTADTLAIMTGGTERMRVTSSGNIGIGTSNPLYPLDVDLDGTLTDFTSGAGILTSSGSTTTTSGHTITIAAKRSIWARDRIISSSDARIKRNIVDIDDSIALEKIRLLEPKYYNYVDSYFKGNDTVMGFVAQQVGDHLPYAVSKQREVIPDVYDTAIVNYMSEVITSNNQNDSEGIDSEGIDSEGIENETTVYKLILTLTTKTHDFVKGDTVRIYDNTNNYIDVKVIDSIDSSSFQIEFNETILNESTVFIYGKFVDDFHVVDKNAIWTVSTAALQEIDRELQLIQTESQIETQLITQLEQRLEQLERN
jgi:hypothetical protein